MFKLPDWKLRSSFWLATILLTATSQDVLRLVFSVSVAIFASPVILDFRLPSWPGFLPFMEKGFKDFTARRESTFQDRTVFAFHPHGAISFGFTVNGLFDSQFLEKSTKMTFLIDDFLRNGNPIFRLFCDVADKSTVHRLMEEGGSVALVLGGFEEATVCETGKDRVVVKSRKGLVKYCLQHGYRLQPVYSFGEDETYHFAQGLLDFRLWLNRFKIPAVAFFGNPIVPWLPRSQARIFTVVGEAIQQLGRCTVGSNGEANVKAPFALGDRCLWNFFCCCWLLPASGAGSTTLTLFTLAVCMILSGVSGVLGGFFEVRLPVTFFALMLLCQCLLEVICACTKDKTGLSGICSMIWDEVMLGGRSTNNITATNLFYSFLSIDVHLWAFGVAASYALQLRIAGKTIWFEPFDDEEDDDGSAIIKGEPSGYGATGDVGSSHDTGPSRAEP
eukprot:g12415.t1